MVKLNDDTTKMNGEITIRGESLGVTESKNERGQIVGHNVQVMKHGARGYDLLRIRLPDGVNPETFKEGMPVELVVDISQFEGTIYYRATRDLRADKPEQRNNNGGNSGSSSTKPAAPSSI
jgi:hypothetical protein